MIHRCVSWGLVALVAASAACFDSDEVFKAAATTTSSDPTTTTTSTSTTTTTTDPTTESSTTGSDATCRDAIDCIFECAAALQAAIQNDPGFEADLSCFLECEETLSKEEALKLIELGNCAAEQCELMGECGMPDTTSTGGSESDGGSSDEGPPPPEGPLDPCIMCIFVLMLDEDYKGCAEFAMACE